MVDNQIHHDFQPVPVRLRDKLVHIVKRPEHRVYILVIRNIVAVIILRRPVYRGQPDNIYAQISQVIQARRDPAQIPYAITISILERPGIYLIYDSIRPPRVGRIAVSMHLLRDCFAPGISHNCSSIFIYRYCRY